MFADVESETFGAGYFMHYVYRNDVGEKVGRVLLRHQRPYIITLINIWGDADGIM